MGGDSRKDFVLATAGNYFGVSSQDSAALQDDASLNSFLDDGSVSVLAAKLDNNKKIIFSNKVMTGRGSFGIWCLRFLCGRALSCVCVCVSWRGIVVLVKCFLRQVVGGQDDDKLIVFFKTRPDVITPDNLHKSVFVSSMIDSPVNSLYHAVQKVSMGQK